MNEESNGKSSRFNTEYSIAFAVLMAGVLAVSIDNRPVQFAGVVTILVSSFLFGRTLRR